MVTTLPSPSSKMISVQGSCERMPPTAQVPPWIEYAGRSSQVPSTNWYSGPCCWRGETGSWMT